MILYAQHAPASTIKPLLAMVVLDNLRPDNFARANQSRHTEVECSCVGLKPGEPYTTRQLLEGLLMVSGNDAANMLADMLGGQRVAVAAMNRKAAAVGARSTRASSPSGLDGPGWESITTPHDLAVIYRAALTYPLIAQIMAQPQSAQVPRQDDHFKPERATDALSRHDRRQDWVHQPRPPHLRRRRSAGQPPTRGRGDVRLRATCTARRSACSTGVSASPRDLLAHHLGRRRAGDMILEILAAAAVGVCGVRAAGELREAGPSVGAGDPDLDQGLRADWSHRASGRRRAFRTGSPGPTPTPAPPSPDTD